jgi:hypothetical protein
MQNNDSTTFYGTVVSSSYGSSITTVTVSPDFGQSVSSNISAISYGFIETGAVSSIPVAVNAGSAAGGSQYQLWIDYDGTNLKWSKNSDSSSATWPINAATATAAAGNSFITQQTGTQGIFSARINGQNDVSLVNDTTFWGLLEQNVGYAVRYDRSTSKYSYGGFTLPDPASSKYVKLPNGLIMQFGQGTASSGGTGVTFATAFPTLCVCVVTTPIVNPAIATSVNIISTVGFSAYSASTTPISYIAFGY